MYEKLFPTNFSPDRQYYYETICDSLDDLKFEASQTEYDAAQSKFEAMVAYVGWDNNLVARLKRMKLNKYANKVAHPDLLAKYNDVDASISFLQSRKIIFPAEARLCRTFNTMLEKLKTMP
jgi:hypothetical protein